MGWEIEVVDDDEDLPAVAVVTMDVNKSNAMSLENMDAAHAAIDR